MTLDEALTAEKGYTVTCYSIEELIPIEELKGVASCIFSTEEEAYRFLLDSLEESLVDVKLRESELLSKGVSPEKLKQQIDTITVSIQRIKEVIQTLNPQSKL